MQLIVLSGGKNLPWSQRRNEFIKAFLGLDLYPANPFQDVVPSATRRTSCCSASMTTHETQTDEVATTETPSIQIREVPVTEPAIPICIDEVPVTGPTNPICIDEVLATEPPNPICIDDVPMTESQTQNDDEATMHENVSSQNRNSKARRLELKRVAKLQKCPYNYWKYVLNHAKMNNVDFAILIEVILKFSKTKQSSYLKTIVKKLFPNMESKESMISSLVISIRSGNIDDVISTIRANLSINGQLHNIMPSSRAIRRFSKIFTNAFISMCKPEATFSGFRCDLVKCVKIAAWLLFETEDISELTIDIWGDGCEIGGVDHTRMCFRILKNYSWKVTVQSATVAFRFSSFRGKDSRFTLEQNLGPSVVGNQETGWLYKQTKELSTQGAIVTCSGDNPYLYRLIEGIDGDASSKYPSDLALYVGEANFLPTDVDPETGFRHKVNVPFRREIPPQSLVHLEDIRCVVPDVTHMITRCVESDLKKVAQKIVREKYPYHKKSIETLEENCTRRELKKPRFNFDVEIRGTSDLKKPTVGPVSLSGTSAIVAIAEKDEFEGVDDLPNIFDNIWNNEIIFDPKNDNMEKDDARAARNAFYALKKLHCEKIPRSDSYKTKDCAQLLQTSLNKCAILLRGSKDGLDIEQFEIWSETYYQCSILLFSGKDGLTPYKLKMIMIPQILNAGFAMSPWHHMCEAMEKSNHQAHKDFQTKTMRGGGKIHNPDPLFYEGFFSFCRYLNVVSKTRKKTVNLLLDEMTTIFATEKSESYIEICQKIVPLPVIDVGAQRKKQELLFGFRFHVVGFFPGVRDNQKGVENMIIEMGGEVLTKEKALGLTKRHSKTPNCFIVLYNDVELKRATSGNGDHNCASGSESDNPVKSTKSSSRRTIKPRITAKGPAQTCLLFAATDFQFLNVAYILDTNNSDRVLDPSKYLMPSATEIERICVTDQRPLFAKQRNPNNTENATTSLVYALKVSRKRARETEQEKVDYVKDNLVKEKHT